MTALPEVEQLYQVWEITEWKDGAVFKTKLTSRTIWLTAKEAGSHICADDNLIYGPMPTTYMGQTIRTRKS